MNNEIFKEIYINGVPSKYLISNKGRIYSKKTNKELIPTLDPDGYVVATLYVDGEYFYYRVHRLVMEYFYEGEADCKESINHIDGDKANNDIDNLEYCTHEYNNWHFRNTLEGKEQPQRAKERILEMRKCAKKLTRDFEEQQAGNPRGLKEISDSEIEEIKQLLMNHVPVREICVNYNIKNSVVKNIIARNTEGKSDIEVTDNDLRAICEDMKTGLYSLTQLANKHNVKRSIVSSIHYRRPKFKYIWKEYFEE